jgi:hypothetical protein
MRRTSFALAGAMGSLALAACGGGGAPSKAEYIKKADAICAKGNQEAATAARSALTSNNPSPEEAQAAVAKVVPVLKKHVAELKALKRPDGDKEQLNTLYAAVDKVVASYEEAAQDPTKAAALFKSDVNDEANKLAADYGMKECSK